MGGMRFVHGSVFGEQCPVFGEQCPVFGEQCPWPIVHFPYKGHMHINCIFCKSLNIRTYRHIGGMEKIVFCYARGSTK